MAPTPSFYPISATSSVMTTHVPWLDHLITWGSLGCGYHSIWLCSGRRRWRRGNVPIDSMRNLLDRQVLNSRAQPPKQASPNQLWNHLSPTRNLCSRLPGTSAWLSLLKRGQGWGERFQTRDADQRLTFLIASMGFVEYTDLGGWATSSPRL